VSQDRQTNQTEGELLMRKIAALIAVLVAVLVVNLALPVFAEEPTASERVVALKSYLVDSQTVLRQYEWVETTIISIDGNETSRKQQRCYYDADGALRKTPVTQPDQKNKRHGLFEEREIEKKQEMSGFMQDAVRLIHQYIPLNPNGILAAKDNGVLSFNITDPGKKGRLTIRDFLKKGDRVDLDLDLTNNRPLSLSIYSYLYSELDPLTLTVTFGSLYGSASFAKEIVLTSKQKEQKVTIQNTDYNKTAQ
jgi:hypothetical protein